MNVNGVTSTDAYAASYTATESTKKTSSTTATASTSNAASTGVVYEPSSAQTTTASKTQVNKAAPELVAKLKADAEARTAQLRSLVEKLMTQQGTAYNKANDIYSFLREGNFTVDPATKAQAQADIAEDGYWGVEQTSDRIVDFAIAISGGSSEDMEDMLEAFKEGYKQAEETWGGKLPEISQKTYDAVLEKFEKYQASLKESTESSQC